MKAAGAIVQAENGTISKPAIARAIAARVMTALVADLERDPENELAAAMAAVEQRLLQSPFIMLATCPDIDTAAEYIKRRTARYVARAGRHISTQQDKIESSAIVIEVKDVLARRYLCHLRQ